MEEALWQIAADTGGTFTDCHALAPDGKEHRVKVLSMGCLRSQISSVTSHAVVISPYQQLPKGFFAGYITRSTGNSAYELKVLDSEVNADNQLVLSFTKEHGFTSGQLIELTTGEAAPVLGARLLTHTSLSANFPPLRFRLATTRATNALLERKGSSVAFFITAGFADLLLIGDQRRAHLFALRHQPREVYYEEVCEVFERLSAQGSVLHALEEERLATEARRLVNQGITTAAVSFLHSDVNAAHEHRAKEILLSAGFTHVSLSSALAPFIRIVPRAQSAVINAYLTGPVEKFISDVRSPLDASSSLHLMTSAAGLEPTEIIKPKDLLLSGPAGGVIGALHAAQQLGHQKIITFDMGGTSTDVARVDGAVAYRFTQSIGGATLLSPSVAIETVAAGGGSICSWTPQGLAVGPHSAGSDPGPACYGRGGPLTITDVNLLLGRFDPTRAPIPLSREAAEQRLDELLNLARTQASPDLTREALLDQLLALATERMADAIRKISVLEGYAPREYALLAFGGAGPQHACGVADALGITTILAPHHAGILSAVGLQQARPERFAQRQILSPLEEVKGRIPASLDALKTEAATELNTLIRGEASLSFRYLAELRIRGQETPLQIEFTESDQLSDLFSARFQHLFGYPPPEAKPVELVSLRVAAQMPADSPAPIPLATISTHRVTGPQLVQDAFSTLVISAGWEGSDYPGLGWVLRRIQPKCHDKLPPTAILVPRLTSIVEDMGALLRRTALSTNIRERLDYSCALLSAEGELVVSAPHIPVHLGALGVCVRAVMRECKLEEGDTIITNHPAYGGSHLPDVTLITPVFDDTRCLLGFVANRAHHAEIGGLSPGSMPAHAKHLEEEGVVIRPFHLCRHGIPDFETIRALLLQARYPTRMVEDNLADLQAQLAANRLGVERVREECRGLKEPFRPILEHSQRIMRAFMHRLHDGSAQEALDDGSIIAVRVYRTQDRLCFDFQGTSPQHAGNLNATPAIVRSAVLYVLRLAIQEDLPLNEGLLANVDIHLPEGSLLNPRFGQGDDPAVVGGNTEISQRVVDTLMKALYLQAGSQGTMNNFLFGNDRFGYYETICGGTGAGEGFAGASAMHSHMTNTAITDVEVIERRYPVRVKQFGLRQGSGGNGCWRGGEGVIREIEFLEPLTVSLLTQHRASGAYGMAGGSPGAPGKQEHLRADGTTTTLPSSATFPVIPGDRVRIETPGGGGYGKADTSGNSS